MFSCQCYGSLSPKLLFPSCLKHPHEYLPQWVQRICVHIQLVVCLPTVMTLAQLATVCYLSSVCAGSTLILTVPSSSQQHYTTVTLNYCLFTWPHSVTWLHSIAHVFLPTQKVFCKMSAVLVGMNCLALSVTEFWGSLSFYSAMNPQYITIMKIREGSPNISQ